MRLNKKMMAVSAVLAVAVMMTACGGSTASSVASSAAASSEPASSSTAAASSEVEQTGDVLPIKVGELDDIKTDSYKFAANITAVKDGQVTMTVYGYDAYEKADIEALEVGDVIETHDQGDTTMTKITVESIDRDEDAGSVMINGGVEEGGLELWVDRDTYRTVTFDDSPVYYAVGELTLPVTDDVTLSDTSADPQADAVLGDGPADLEEAFNADPENWTANNTTVFTDNGKVNGILRVWVP